MTSLCCYDDLNPDRARCPGRYDGSYNGADRCALHTCAECGGRVRSTYSARGIEELYRKCRDCGARPIRVERED